MTAFGQVSADLVLSGSLGVSVRGSRGLVNRGPDSGTAALSLLPQVGLEGLHSLEIRHLRRLLHKRTHGRVDVLRIVVQLSSDKRSAGRGVLRNLCERR